MLNLTAATEPGWVERVVADLDALLLDHAHCEKKAAGMAVQLIFRYPQHDFLLQPLAALAREELLHFEQVLEILCARGIAFRAQRPSPYAGQLKRHVRAAEPDHLVDTLLCCALIEARSCERFQLLAERVPDAGLADFYRGLLASEARHHAIYLALARRLAPAEAVQVRLAELAACEAAALVDAPPWSRMHT